MNTFFNFYVLEYINIYIFITLHIYQESDFFKKFFIITYFCLLWVLVAACGLSLVAASRGYSLDAVFGLLIAVASLVAEHRL